MINGIHASTVRLNKYMRRLWLIIIVFLGGCATAPRPIPPELQYVAPAGEESSLATLVGSQEKSTAHDNLTAYVLAVDGKLVMSGPQGWNITLPIQPGLRNVTVAFQSGGFNTQADLQLQATAGRKYQVQFSTDVQFLGANTYCDFWIIDIATRKPVTGIGCGGIVNPPY